MQVVLGVLVRCVYYIHPYNILFYFLTECIHPR